MEKEHRYFKVTATSYREDRKPKETVLAIYAQEAPKLREDGSISSLSMSFPSLVVTAWVADQEDFANKVAEVLQENAHRFFSSATTSQSQIEEPRSGDTGTAEQPGSSLTQKIEDPASDEVEFSKVMP